MKIVFLGSYYGRYLARFYEKHPALPDRSYREQQQLLLNDYFGELGSYIKWTNKLGHDATPIIYNCEPLQRRWAMENGVPFPDDWPTAIAIEQVKRLAPDLFFMDSIFNLYGDFLDEIKKYVGKVMGWIACPIPQEAPLNQMALILSSHPEFVDSFRQMGINSEMLLPAFDPDLLEEFPGEMEQDVDVSFIGGISPEHKKRQEFLERIARKTSLRIWGYGFEASGRLDRVRRRFFPSPLEKCYMGEAWGIEMYRVLKRSKITLNCHIDAAGNIAGNMRMFEATGAGTLLVTDNKSNLANLFIPGKEVVTYDSADDAIDKINYYLSHERERREIAEAGQRRTLRDYNYQKTVRQMLDYFAHYL